MQTQSEIRMGLKKMLEMEAEISGVTDLSYPHCCFMRLIIEGKGNICVEKRGKSRYRGRKHDIRVFCNSIVSSGIIYTFLHNPM